ncbi:hypothetical protein [Bacterioplanoides sp.]|uniref:hypothetical protein n=1 Tax=Bacterioplanoides sp. TaxID=2066072 RepID=UPI003B5B60A2
MTTTYYEHDFDNLILMYDEVCNWFSGLGFEYSKNRYGIYKRFFQKFIDLAEGKIVEDDLLGFKRSFDNAYIEVNEIIRIKNCLSNIEVSEFLDQVKKITSGQEFRGNTDNDQARDFLFELSIASRFIQAGYSVTLNGICDVVVDLVDDGMLFVECKRVKSEAQIEKNVKKANKQVLKRISSEKSSKVHGLVAVNITDLLPKTNMLYPDSQSAATAIHRGVSNNYVKARLDRFSAGSKNKCFGIMVESQIMNYLSDKALKNGFIYSRHTEYLPYTENSIFKRLAPKLSNQDIIR